MRVKSVLLMCVMALVSFGSSANAQDLESAPGEVHVSMNLAYAKVLVNGEEWDDTEFRGNGKTLIISGLDRNQSYDISLEASEEGYAKLDFKIDSKKRYKKQRKKRVIRFVAKHKAVFKKAEAEPSPEKPAVKDADKVVPEERKAPSPAGQKQEIIMKAPGKDALKQADPSKIPHPKQK